MRSQARGAVRESSWVPVTGAVLVALATAFRAWAIAPAWFFYDDFFFIQKARAGLSASYLVQPYNGHLMPASWLLTWFNVHAAPFGFEYPRTEIIALFALSGLGVLHLMTTMFGRRWASLGPLVLYLFSPVLLPATTWWAAAVNQLPMVAATAFSLAAFVRYLRDHRTRQLVVSTLCLAAGLAFVERALVAVFVMWLVAVLYFAAGTFPDRVRHLWRTHRPAVLLHGGVVAAYLAVYVPYAMNFDAVSITRRPLFGVLANLAGIAFPVGVGGGPLRWHQSDVTQSAADPPQLVLIAGWLLIAGLVLASVRLRHRGARAWLIPASVLLVNAVLIASSRAIFFGREVALDYRFQTELALLFPLALGLAFLPVTRSVECSEPNGRSSWFIQRGTALSALAVFVVAATISTSAFPLRNLTTTSPRRYVHNFEATAHAHRGAQVLDLPTPSYMWAAFSYPTNLASRMLEPLASLVEFRASVTDDAWRIDQAGRLQPLFTREARMQASPVRGDGCFGRLHAGRETTWLLNGPVVGVEWFTRLAYLAEEPARLEITVDGVTRTVRLLPGRHAVVTPAPGEYHSVSMRLASGAEVCLRHLGVVAVATG